MSDSRDAPNESEDRGTGWAGIEAVQALLDEFPTGSIFSYLIDRMPGVQAHKVATMLALMLRHAGTSADQVRAQMEGDPLLRRLIWDCSRAAAETELDDKIRALALVASEAVIDDARIDESQHRTKTLSQVGPLHIRMMRVLDERTRQEEGEGVEVADALGISVPLAESIASDLLRLALAESPGMSFRTLHRQLRKSLYGSELLAYLRGMAPPRLVQADDS